MGMRTAYCGSLSASDIGREVAVCGWVARRREHGEHLAFIDLRDHTGLLQCVVDGAHALRSEFVVRIRGVVRRRPEGTVNLALPTGEVEIGECEVEILAEAESPPFSIDGRNEADESVRLKYRFLDLRSERMQRNLRLRAAVFATLRSHMASEGFTELETPLLWTPTPEGAREFAIPSRLQHGSFYVLPQSPQIAKQLSMVGGFDRYFQIARCMRDEDLRADRQFEFSQLDIEASFLSEGEIRGVVGRAIIAATELATGESVGEIPEISWDEAMERWGTDKPDLRFGMELVDLTGVFSATEFNAFSAPCVKAICLAGGAELGRAKLDGLIERAKGLGAKGLVWMRVVDGAEGKDLDSPVTKFLSDAERSGTVAAVGASVGDLVLVVAGEPTTTALVLGQLRVDLGRPPVTEGPRKFCWITDFPLFEALDGNGNPIAAHHPFTMPKPEHLDLLESDPLAVRAQCYDLVLNGWELGSGSIRIHRAEIQSRLFARLGISGEEAEERFGFFLGALRFGAPPHGGFAVGLDRLVAILAGEENIR
ncbi:MAG TPA: aspartate--tRNA ligase, partial [Acidimicrobiales bacterium]|nr:aspartate--tRNA ligase [Acidimicrobiales bacterium]